MQVIPALILLDIITLGACVYICMRISLFIYTYTHSGEAKILARLKDKSKKKMIKFLKNI